MTGRASVDMLADEAHLNLPSIMRDVFANV